MVNKHKKRFSKYAIVGLSGVFVNEGLLFLLTEFMRIFYLISSAIAIEVSIITNFILNEKWTFKDVSADQKGIIKRGVKFNIVSIAGLLINMVILFAMTSMFGIHYLISNLFGIAGATLWNYFVNVFWTWKN